MTNKEQDILDIEDEARKYTAIGERLPESSLIAEKVIEVSVHDRGMLERHLNGRVGDIVDRFTELVGRVGINYSVKGIHLYIPGRKAMIAAAGLAAVATVGFLTYTKNPFVKRSAEQMKKRFNEDRKVLFDKLGIRTQD